MALCPVPQTKMALLATVVVVIEDLHAGYHTTIAKMCHRSADQMGNVFREQIVYALLCILKGVSSTELKHEHCNRIASKV
ncbi:hypothetical protein OESDEN_19212 [Oesophagostomum dentatum]|uniref:Uncharacterized protein n=1 Tax=Oesophagostomum dentatum TaxID=61180 RepID=A0A0B1SC61_OESDE|nr:hypothetical protein OESDEN_19212 [Oesophagostomum dentatum]